ncbi:MAG: excinuclease UvrABC nuclease subunit [Candidatus Nitrosomirales archaeon]|jgi:excinuclease UvrABC nuclease subunit
MTKLGDSILSNKPEVTWSEWMDFDRSKMEAVPELAGVYAMHAAMKILYIGSSINLRQSLVESLSNPCISKAKRFHYMITENHHEMKEKLVNEYRQNHGRLPECMEE